MRRLEGPIRRQLVNILLLFLLGAFVLLTAELWLTNHVDGIQNVAVIAAILGAAAVLAGFFVKHTARHLVVMLLVVLSLSGLLGAWEHLESREGSEARTVNAQAAGATSNVQPIAFQASPMQQEEREEDEQRERGEGEEGEREEGEGAPPPLAPLSLSGLALMGAVTLLAKQDES